MRTQEKTVLWKKTINKNVYYEDVWDPQKCYVWDPVGNSRREDIQSFSSVRRWKLETDLNISGTSTVI